VLIYGDVRKRSFNNTPKQRYYRYITFLGEIMSGLLERIQKQQEEERQARIEFMKIHLPREESNTAEGIKSLLAINGGGIVAMLGFMQALVSKPVQFALFTSYGANAMLMFSIGVVFAALTPAARVIFIKRLIAHQTDDSDYPRLLEQAGYVCWGLSLSFFLVGVICASFGIRHAFLS
jgi:hypothetical protein